MKEQDLVKATAKDSGLTEKDAQSALNALTSAVSTALREEHKVTLVGFGTWEHRQRLARKGMNPRTKQEVKIPTTKIPVFKAGKALKDSIKEES